MRHDSLYCLFKEEERTPKNKETQMKNRTKNKKTKEMGWMNILKQKVAALKTQMNQVLKMKIKKAEITL